MKNLPKRCVVFDLGGVLVEISPTRVEKALTSKMTQPLPALKDWQAHHQFERGQMTELEFLDQVNHLTGQSLSYNAFVERWNQVFVKEIPGVASLVEQLLSHHIEVAILSNTNSIHLAYAKTHFPVLSLFPSIFASHEMGVRKPEQLIFKKILTQLTLPAEQVLFIDDTTENLNAAREMGIESEHCENSSLKIKTILERVLRLDFVL